MTEEHQFARDLIERMAAAAHTDLTGLARRAGIAPSTLTRFVNGESKWVPTTRTLFKLSKASGVPLTPLKAGELNKEARISAVVALASSLQVDLIEAAALMTQSSGHRLVEWMEIIKSLPSEAEDNAFLTLRSLVEAHRAAQHKPEPRKTGRVGRKGQTPP